MQPEQPPADATELPLFNTTRGIAMLTTMPPFSLEDAVLHYFPLAADAERLQAFCDNYINISPDHWFRVAAPWVTMVSAHYPRMGFTYGNLGYASQDELVFAIPVEWHRRVDGHWRYEGIAQVSPFIYVNDLQSQVEGREVFGWPKVLAQEEPQLSTWLADPRAQRVLLSLRTDVIVDPTNGRVTDEQLIRILENAPDSLTLMPPDLESLQNPADILTRATRSVGGAWWHWLWWLASAITQGRSDAASYLTDGVQGLVRQMTTMNSCTINLKQFRDAENPAGACYQSLTASMLSTDSINRCGLLGDTRQLRGDLSGGYRIELYDYPSLPIVASLGLRTEQTSIGSSGVVRSLIAPVMPFWAEVDLRYHRARTLTWRTAGASTQWHTPSAHSVAQASSPSQMTSSSMVAEPQQNKQPTPPKSRSPAHPWAVPEYVSAGSSAFQVAEGPFEFHGASYRVLPLQADQQTLQNYLQSPGHPDQSLFGQVASDLRVEPEGDCVFMVIGAGEMRARDETINQSGQTWVRFLIPCKVTSLGDRPHNWGLVFVNAYMYTNSPVGATTAREVNGWPVAAARIERMASEWASDTGPEPASQPLLNVRVNMPSMLNAGQPFEEQTLFEIGQEPLADSTASDAEQHAWAQHLQAAINQQRKTLLEFASPFITADEMNHVIEWILQCLNNPSESISFTNFLAERVQAEYQRDPKQFAGELISRASQFMTNEAAMSAIGGAGLPESIVAALNELKDWVFRLMSEGGDFTSRLQALLPALLSGTLNTQGVEPGVVTAANTLLSWLNGDRGMTNTRDFSTWVMRQSTLYQFSLKQFRDATFPEHACYQSVVVNSGKFTPTGFGPLDTSLTVRIADYPTQPIVAQLGLKPVRHEIRDGRRTAVLRPMQPFWFRANVTTDLGHVLCQRTPGSTDWQWNPNEQQLHPNVPAVRAEPDFLDWILNRLLSELKPESIVNLGLFLRRASTDPDSPRTPLAIPAADFGQVADRMSPPGTWYTRDRHRWWVLNWSEAQTAAGSPAASTILLAATTEGPASSAEAQAQPVAPVRQKAAPKVEAKPPEPRKRSATSSSTGAASRKRKLVQKAKAATRRQEKAESKTPVAGSTSQTDTANNTAPKPKSARRPGTKPKRPRKKWAVAALNKTVSALTPDKH